jgi:WD40 repeat protein
MEKEFQSSALREVEAVPAPPSSKPKYWTFVSYSHHDREWGEWLQKSLETYRVPRKLVGRASQDGTIPRRLFPTFRDCAELPAAANLGAQLDEALRRSRYLVVVCSPAAAASRWVNEEIKAFKTSGREGRVLALIVDGEPNASAAPEGKERECFPESLRFQFTPEGKLSETPAEPIAADVRPGQDSKATGRLRLIAGLIGVSFDELRQRERRRRAWRLVEGVLLVILVGLLIGVVWQGQEILKRRQRVRQAMENFTNLGQKELHAGHLMRAAVYLSQAYKLGDDSLKLHYLLARALPAIDAQGASLQQAGQPIGAVAFDSRGRYLLSLSPPSTVKVWDAVSAKLVAMLDQHRAPASSATFSHDGKHIVTASYDRTAKIWDAGTGHLLRSLDGHPSLLESAIYSPDDTLLLTVGADATGRLWDAFSGQMLAELDRNVAVEAPVAFAPGGDRLITGGKQPVLWSTTTGQAIRLLATRQDNVQDACFSPNGKKVATVSRDGSLQVWDGDAGDLLETWISGTDPLTFVAWLSDNRTLLVLSDSGAIYRYDSEDRKVLDSWQTGLRSERPAAFDPARMWLVLIGPDGIPTVWDMQTGDRLLTLEGQREKAVCAAINPGARLVVTGATDGTIMTWNLSRCERSLSLPGNGSRVNAAQFSPDGKWILTAGSDTGAKIWDETGTLVATLGGHEGGIDRATFDPVGTRIATISSEGEIGLWSVPDWKCLHMVRDAQVTGAAFSSDGERLLMTASERYAELFKIASWEPLASIEERTALRSVAFSPNGKFLAIGSEDGTIDLRDGHTGAFIRLLWAHSGAVSSMQFSVDSTRLVTAGSDSTALIWRISDGQVISAMEGHTKAIRMARFNADGSRIVTASDDKTARIWLAKSGKQIAALDDHLEQVSSAMFSPDGKFVATASDDGTVKIWSAETGQLLQSLEGHGGEMSCAEFSPDSRQIVTGGVGPIARVWDLTLESRSSPEVDALIRQRVPRRLTEIAKAPTEPVTRLRMLADAKKQPSSTLDSDNSSHSEKVVRAFMEALAKGDSDRLAAMIAPDCESNLDSLRDRQESMEGLAKIAARFAGANITETIQRRDGHAAFVEMRLPNKGLLTIFLDREDAEWKIVRIVGRARPSQ